MRAFPGAQLTVVDGGRQVLAEAVSLSPAATFRRRIPGQLSAGTYTVRVTDAPGRGDHAAHRGRLRLLARQHADGPAADAAGDRRPRSRTDGDYVAIGQQQELDGQLLAALATYQDGLKRYPESLELNRAAGRLMVGLKQYDAAVPLLTKALARVSNDREAAYYLGVAQFALGRSRPATVAFENAQQYGPHRAAALLELAAMAWRSGSPRPGGRPAGRAAARSAGRRAGRRDGSRAAANAGTEGPGARAGLAALSARSTRPVRFLRYEATKLGSADEALWAHLAADPERILELAVDYMRFGLYENAIELLAPHVPDGRRRRRRAGHAASVGLPPHRATTAATASARSVQDGAPTIDTASLMPTTYVFPHRPESMTVLQGRRGGQPERRDRALPARVARALRRDGGCGDEVVGEGADAQPAIPTLHRNMGYTLLATAIRSTGRSTYSAKARSSIASNVGVYTGLDLALTQAGPSGRRARAGPAELSGPEGAAGVARLPADARAGGGRPLRRGRAAVPGPLLPARGGRHQRAPGLARGAGAPRAPRSPRRRTARARWASSTP